MLTMLCATPRFERGLEVRAMSNPITEPGPPADSTTMSSTSSQRGAGPGSIRTAVQVSASATTNPSSSRDRRIG